MKNKIFITFFFCIVSASLFGQKTYIDPTTTLALKLYSDNLKSQQKKTSEEQSKLRKAQTFVHAQMIKVNKIQDKVYKGLREVSGTLQNGMQVKQMYATMRDCQKYASRIRTLVANKPQYAVFGVKASQKAYEQILKIGNQLSSILTENDKNLATAGDRYKILFEIQGELQTLKIWLISTSISIERAVQIGFLAAINPFQGYINTDKTIVEGIMYKLGYKR